MKLTGEILDKLNVPYEKQVVSAHRMPAELMKFGQTARERGDRKSTRLNSSHANESRMPSSA